MAKKASQPALYEMIRAREQSGLPLTVRSSRSSRVGDDDSLDGGRPTWLTPGRVIRIPVGYMLLAAAVLIVTLAFAYGLGHRRGQAEARNELVEYVKNTAPEVNDPLVSLNRAGEPIPLQGGDRSSVLSVTGTLASDKGGGGGAARHVQPRGWGPVQPAKDPREPGKNYFILMTTLEPGAVKLAEFCRQHGLETYALKSKGRLWQVVAFPGFEASNRNSREVQATEELIRRIGDKWKETERNATDLRGYYPARYNG